MKITGAVLEEIGRPRPFADSRPISISELELEGPGPTEILVRIEAAGICHSDLSVVDGNRVRPVPMLLGHEAAGRVVEVGSDVTDLVPGQRVVMSFLPRCEQCENCAEDGRLPCTAGSKSNGEGTLLHGSMHLDRERREDLPPPRRLRLRHPCRRGPRLGRAGRRRHPGGRRRRPRLRRADRRRCRPERRPAQAAGQHHDRGPRRRGNGRADHGDLPGRLPDRCRGHAGGKARACPPPRRPRNLHPAAGPGGQGIKARFVDRMRRQRRGPSKPPSPRPRWAAPPSPRACRTRKPAPRSRR